MTVTIDISKDVSTSEVGRLLAQWTRAGVPWADEPVEFKEDPVVKAASEVGRDRYEKLSNIVGDHFVGFVMAELCAPASADGDVATVAGAVWRAEERFMKAVKGAYGKDVTTLGA